MPSIASKHYLRNVLLEYKKRLFLEINSFNSLYYDVYNKRPTLIKNLQFFSTNVYILPLKVLQIISVVSSLKVNVFIIIASIKTPRILLQ